MNLRKKIRALVNSVGMAYVKSVCKKEYLNQKFVNFNERSIEFAFLFKYLSSIWPKNILDVGSGMTALPHLIQNCGFQVTAIDNIRDYWPSGMVNRHFHIIDDDIKDSNLQKDQFDFIACISVLEHIEDHESAIKSMVDLLKIGGSLMLSFPYTENAYCGNVYLHPDSSVGQKYPFVTQSFSRSQIDVWLKKNSLEVVDQEYWTFFTGHFWTCGERLVKPVKVNRNNSHQLTCVLLKKI